MRKEERIFSQKIVFSDSTLMFEMNRKNAIFYKNMNEYSLFQRIILSSHHDAIYIMSCNKLALNRKTIHAASNLIISLSMALTEAICAKDTNKNQ